jgi:tetratricopeptide (TPR) repeat protein
MNFPKIDDFIKSGEILAAQKALHEIPLSKVERADFALFASLARRAGLPLLAVRLLNPVMRPVDKLLAPPTLDETVEYAIALIKIGSIEEGRALLMDARLQDHAQAKYFLALSYFPEWDYAAGAARLEEYMNLGGHSDYQNLVAQVNLCAAYTVLGRHKDALKLARDLLVKVEAGGLKLLHGNVLELMAQNQIRMGEFSSARRSLETARGLLGEAPLADSLYVRKWLAIIEVMDGGDTSPLMKAREEATLMGHWETVRDLDLHLACARGDHDLFQHLFHGTPYAAYRERLKKLFPSPPAPASSYDWRLGSASSGPVLDMQTVSPGGRLLVQLLQLLMSDFYRAHNLASLATKLFPGEFYNPVSTPNRVHQLITRLRTWFVAENLPLSIEESGGAYRLAAHGPITLRVHPVRSGASELIGQIGSAFGSQSFSARELAELKKISLSTASRLLKSACDEGSIVRMGRGAQTKFRLSAA